MQYVLCFIVQQNFITTAIKLATLQQNWQYHVHDACQLPYIFVNSLVPFKKICKEIQPLRKV